ncbi:MAG: pyruvate formate lyase-activating protein [Peptococcaceae bacterium BICA1-8]|nr:MAG: pyruvate formate lyase-activating protein [Peptococcaceae bacterium BICA1-8]
MALSLNYDKNKYGHVFNIQQFSIHDGPGIRTLVFLKGCPLQCSWCSNPESQKPQPELGYNSNKCLGTNKCIRCIEVCITGAITNGTENKITIDRAVCTNCLLCVDACPSGALNVYGNLMSIDQVLKEVEKDSIFYTRSGGGISLSGGEPLSQPDFAIGLLKEAKRRRMNTAMETCGYTDWAILNEACQYLNLIIFDIKSMDSKKHKRYTHVSNELILENFNKLCNKYPDLPKLVRTPVIPGFNDNETDIQAILDFIKDKPNVKYELLPYHRLGTPKYEYIGRDYPLGDIKIDDEKMNSLKELVEKTFAKE